MHTKGKEGTNLNSDFNELLSLLNQARVNYLVVGGYAVIEHTEPRYTKDLDIWVKTDAANAARVYSVLKKFGAPLNNISVEDFTDPGVVYHMGRPPSRIDVLMGLKGLDFDACWQNRFEAKYGDEIIPFLSNQDLVTNKSLVGRPQDLMDVDNLLLAQKRTAKAPPATSENKEPH